MKLCLYEHAGEQNSELAVWKYDPNKTNYSGALIFLYFLHLITWLLITKKIYIYKYLFYSQIEQHMFMKVNKKFELFVWKGD